MLIRLVRRGLRPRWPEFAAVVVLQLLATAALLYLPRLAADAVDDGVARGDLGHILAVGRLMLLLSLGQVVCAVVATYLSARIAMGLGRDLRSALFGRVGELSGTEVAGFGVPTLVTRTVNDVQQLQVFTLLSCTVLVMAPAMCLGGVVMAVRQDVGLAGLLAVAVPLLAVAVTVIVARMTPRYRLVQRGLDEVSRMLREQLGGLRVVRAFVREPYEIARFGAADAALTAASIGAGRWFALLMPVLMLVMNASGVAVVWFGGLRVDAGTLGAGSMIAFLSYLAQILVSVLNAAFLAVVAPRAAVAAERVAAVLDTAPTVRPPARPVPPPARRGVLELAGVDFRYPGADVAVLAGVSLRAVPGETVAVVGGTGAGKSALLSLVPRLCDVTGGRVLVDGVDVRDLDPERLRERLALVPQRPYLFAGTVASNLRYGNPDATDAELADALSVAQALDFVTALPDGLDAAVAPGGGNFSGGQRQRLSVARALVRPADIYLLDDAFSALDAATDARLRAALRARTAHATVVMVAQRVATVADADRILVLEGGAIAGSGRHDELVATNRTYAEFVASQLADRRIA